MFKKISFAILFCGFLLSSNYTFSAAAVGQAPVEHFVDGEEVDHLPQRLRPYARDFYRKFDEACCDVPGIKKGASVLNGKEHASFVDHYAPERLALPTAAAAAAAGTSAATPDDENPLENGLIRFIDWIIAEDGIGTVKNPVIATSAKENMVDLHVASRVVKIPHTQIEFFETHFIPTLAKSSEAGNPIAQYLRGVLFYHGIGVKANQEHGRDLLLLSARGHYGRASDFLSGFVYADPAIIKPPEVIRLHQMLDEEDPVEAYLEEYIKSRKDALSISDATLDGLKEVLKVLPGNTGRLLGVYSNLSRLLEEKFLELPTSTPTFTVTAYNAYSTLIHAIPASGYFLWAYDEYLTYEGNNFWGGENFGWWTKNSIYIGTGAALAFETLKSGGNLLGNFIGCIPCYGSCCRRRPLPEKMSRRVLLDEARLTALYVVAKKSEEIITEGTAIEETYATKVLNLLDKKPIERGVSITKHLLDNIRHL